METPPGVSLRVFQGQRLVSTLTDGLPSGSAPPSWDSVTLSETLNHCPSPTTGLTIPFSCLVQAATPNHHPTPPLTASPPLDFSSGSHQHHSCSGLDCVSVSALSPKNITPWAQQVCLLHLSVPSGAAHPNTSPLCILLRELKQDKCALLGRPEDVGRLREGR